MEYIKIEKKDGEIEEMPIGEFARWMCLMEALFFIRQKAEEMDIDFTQLLKINAINDYINERCPSMLHDVECERQLGNI